MKYTKCKKIVPGMFLFILGCGPVALDLSFSSGANQDIEKTYKVTQKATAAQTAAGVSLANDVVSVLPLFVREAPTPTPIPVEKRVYGLVVEVQSTPTPFPPVVKKVTRLKAVPVPSPCLTK